MLLNSQEVFSDAQAVTSTAISTNVIDLNPVGGPNALQDIGQGEDVYLIVRTVTAATDSGSDATLTVSLESDSTANLATSATVHFSTGALAFAAFSPAGTQLVAIKLPAGDYERYLGVRYTVASGPLTAGAFDAFLVKDADFRKYYASGFSVL
jgi:hypothetical protein